MILDGTGGTLDAKRPNNGPGDRELLQRLLALTGGGGEEVEEVELGSGCGGGVGGSVCVNGYNGRRDKRLRAAMRRRPRAV